MSSLNRATIIGRLGKDPEVRYTADGKPVATFSVATEETWKNKNGEKQKKTEWHNIVAWNKLAEIVEEYVCKGMLVFIEGKMQTREYTDRDGIKRRTFEIIAHSLQMLAGGKPKDQTSHAEDHGPADDGFIPEVEEDDVPL